MTDAIDEALRPSMLGPELAAALGDPAWRDLDAELIAGGKSNLTFRLSAAGTELILRRPPLGDLLPRAHDMGRERRILDALAPTPVPVPAVLHFGGEGNVLGVDYYVMEVVPGVIVRDALPDGFAETPREREALTAGLIDTLAALHTVGLQDDLRRRARELGIPVRPVRLTAREIAQEVEDGGIALVMISQGTMHPGNGGGHWIVLHGTAGGMLLAQDPWVDADAGETWVDGSLLPIPEAALDEMSLLGGGEPYRAVILLSPPDAERS